MVDRNGLHIDPDKVRAMLEIAAPTNIKEVRRKLERFPGIGGFVP